jgi:hypothetical protein
VQFTNTGSLSHAFDVIVAIGTVDPNTGQFTASLISYTDDVPSDPGQTASATVDFANTALLNPGTYTIAVFLVDWDPDTRTVSTVYDSQGCGNVLVVA